MGSPSAYLKSPMQNAVMTIAKITSSFGRLSSLAAPLTMTTSGPAIASPTVWLPERRGIVIAATPDKRVAGVFTAGDLTRLLERTQDIFGMTIESVMTQSPKVASTEELASAAVYRMEQIGIMAMPVVDNSQHIVGVVHLHDLMRAGVA